MAQAIPSEISEAGLVDWFDSLNDMNKVKVKRYLADIDTSSKKGFLVDLMKRSSDDHNYGLSIIAGQYALQQDLCDYDRFMVTEAYIDGLFGSEDADCVGKIIRFKSIPFRIVGVLKSKGYNNWGMDQDNVMIAPYTTVMKRIAAQTYFGSIVMSALAEELSDEAIEEVTQILRHNHKLWEDAEDDFTIRSQAEWMETMSTTMDTITLILVVAAAFSLLVAGIGIMNIMLVSVTERTKEIGLRMSVGARGIDIMSQFLIESVMISLTGAFLGVALGYGGSWLAANVFMLPSSVPFWAVGLSFAICAFIGIFFGYVPARKAARMDPIEAIRYE